MLFNIRLRFKLMTTQKRDKIEFNGTEYDISMGQYPLELLFFAIAPG